MEKLIKLKCILNMANKKKHKNSPFCLSSVVFFSLCLSLLQILSSPPAIWIVPGCFPGAGGARPRQAESKTGYQGSQWQPCLGHQAPPWVHKLPQFQAPWLGYKGDSLLWGWKAVFINFLHEATELKAFCAPVLLSYIQFPS